MSLAVMLLLSATPGIPDITVHECIDAEFIQSREIPALERTLEMQGRMHVEKAGVLEWVVTTPFSYTYRIGPDGIEEILPDGSRQQLALDEAPWLAAVGRLLQATMSGDLSALQQYFDVRELTDDVDPASRKFVLHPLDAALAGALQDIEMTWKEWPVSVVMRTSGGGETRIRFKAVMVCDSNSGTTGS